MKFSKNLMNFLLIASFQALIAGQKFNLSNKFILNRSEWVVGAYEKSPDNTNYQEIFSLKQCVFFTFDGLNLRNTHMRKQTIEYDFNIYKFSILKGLLRHLENDQYEIAILYRTPVPKTCREDNVNKEVYIVNGLMYMYMTVLDSNNDNWILFQNLNVSIENLDYDSSSLMFSRNKWLMMYRNGAHLKNITGILNDINNKGVDTSNFFEINMDNCENLKNLCFEEYINTNKTKKVLEKHSSLSVTSLIVIFLIGFFTFYGLLILGLTY